MLHEPASSPSGPDHAVAYKVRLGMILFVAYALFYIGFIAISIHDVTLMEKQIFLGLNLAVVYGFGLIFVALVLALVYNFMCTKKEKLLNGPKPGAKDTAASEDEEKSEGGEA